MEYLFIVALTFSIIIPTAYLFYSYSRESGQQIADSQIQQLGANIIDAAQSIYYSGQGSRTELQTNVPDGIDSVMIMDGKELVFNLSTEYGVSEIVFFSSINITAVQSDCALNYCKLPGLASPGLRKIKIEAITKDSVEIETI